MDARTRLFCIETGLPGRFAIAARPRPGEWMDDDVHGWRASGLDWVVSLLEDAEVAELSLHAEGDSLRAAGLEFARFPIADRGVPSSRADFDVLLSRIESALRSGRNVAVHCRMGLGRSALLAAGLLVRLGHQPRAAWVIVAKARGQSVPDTDAQRAWVVGSG